LLAEALREKGQARARPFGAGGRSDDHTNRSRVQRCLDRLGVTQPAAHLHRYPGGRDLLDESRRGASGERAVEIDEVEPGRALGGVSKGRRLRVATFDRDMLAPPLREPHAAAVEDVDRRDDGEGLHGCVVTC
jgi:hypothetical protein